MSELEERVAKDKQRLWTKGIAISLSISVAVLLLLAYILLIIGDHDTTLGFGILFTPFASLPLIGYTFGHCKSEGDAILIQIISGITLGLVFCAIGWTLDLFPFQVTGTTACASSLLWGMAGSLANAGL